MYRHHISEEIVVRLTAMSKVIDISLPGNTHWNVPRAPNPRRSLLDKMKKHLITERGKNDLAVFVLQGMGGVGKTEAAIVFATENQDRFVVIDRDQGNLLTESAFVASSMSMLATDKALKKGSPRSQECKYLP
jgi:hypothetical protein